MEANFSYIVWYFVSTSTIFCLIHVLLWFTSGDLSWCNISKTWSAFLGRNSSFPTFPDDVVWGIYNSHHYIAFAFRIFLTQKNARRLILKRWHMWHIQCFSFVVSINFLLVSPTSKQVEALWCPDFHEHFRPPENLAVSRRVAPSVLPWCHSPKEPGRWFRAFSGFRFMGFLWENLKEKKGISSLTSFSEHWLFGGAHEISKDAHVPTV